MSALESTLLRFGAFPRRQASVHVVRQKRGEGMWLLRECYSFYSYVGDNMEWYSMLRWCLCWHNGFKRPVLKHGPRSLTCLRVFGWKTRARNESDSWEPLLGRHRCPELTFCDASEVEHICWDPKDGELCLNRAKPEETLVEAHSDSDVQINCQIWVWAKD